MGLKELVAQIRLQMKAKESEIEALKAGLLV